MAAASAPAKPKGKGLNGKIGPVPVKVAIFIVVAAVVYLFIRHRAATTTTSAGSNTTPAATDSGLPFSSQGDATGGGSSGGSGDFTPAPDTAPTASTPFNFYFSSVPPDTGGGNVSTPVATSNSTATQPVSSFPGAGAGAVGGFAGVTSSPTSQPNEQEQSFNPGPYISLGGGGGLLGNIQSNAPSHVAPPPPPQPKPKPPSGYSQQSNANLH